MASLSRSLSLDAGVAGGGLKMLAAIGSRIDRQTWEAVAASIGRQIRKSGLMTIEDNEACHGHVSSCVSRISSHLAHRLCAIFQK